MKTSVTINNTMIFVTFIFAVILMCLTTGCNKTKSVQNELQGYVEGDFVYVAAPSAGRLQAMYVQKGKQVAAGEPLFELDNVQEKGLRDETSQRLAQLRSQLADVRKGKRPTEIGSTTAQLNLARAALQFSEQELIRLEKLLAEKVVSFQEVERLRSLRDQDRQRVAQLEADLGTANLGARSDQIAAAESSAKAMEAVLARNEWDLIQKRQTAPTSGVVFDTLYRVGEWVAAGRPAVVLLPAGNVKVRIFVPQMKLAGIHQGEAVQVAVDGAPAPLPGTIRFISPQAEYTPPVIYSRESSQKLVYLVEIGFDAAEAAQLHPGQPVTVRLGSLK